MRIYKDTVESKTQAAPKERGRSRKCGTRKRDPPVHQTHRSIDTTRMRKLDEELTSVRDPVANPK